MRDFRDRGAKDCLRADAETFSFHQEFLARCGDDLEQAIEFLPHRSLSRSLSLALTLALRSVREEYGEANRMRGL
ncbi:Lactase-Phlorizin Hydrolase [Manis pentadactyla]|nr:Lactase-Phlorizin Hydrolase [Manis pentadactyla]